MAKRILPIEFIDRLHKEFGPAAEDLIDQLISTEPAARTLRVLDNVDPYEINGYENLGKVPWCESAQWFKRNTVDDASPIHHSPGYQVGAWHIQEASGLLVDYMLLKIRAMGFRMNLMLDACAAPGGKTLTMLNYLPPMGLLVAAESQQDRLQTLMETVSRTGSPQVIVVNASATDWGAVPNLWDGILVDMPCSGEGMFRKNQEAIKEWSLVKCESCSKIQQSILESVVQSLQPGGWLIYSTCTYGFSENTELLMPWVKKGILKPMEIQIPEDWGFTLASTIDQRWPEGGSAWWALPGKVPGEGFFCAVLQKARLRDLVPWNVSIDSAHQTAEKAALLKGHMPKNAKIVRDGLTPWMREGVPSQDLAHALGRRRTSELQAQLDSQGFEWHEISLEEPLATWYLQGQTLRMGELQEGWNLMCYQGFGLGWMHKMGEKVTNYFPKSRRIKR